MVILILFAAAACTVIYFETKKLGYNFVDVICIHDVSRSTTLELTPDAPAICDLYRFHLAMNQRAIFRKSYITGGQIITPTEVAIPKYNPADNTDKDIEYRTQQVRRFFDGVTKIVHTQPENKFSTAIFQGSQVYITIAHELRIFKSATEKIMVVYSGLFESSEIFRSDFPDEIQLLLSHPKVVARRFKKALRIKRAKDARVIFAYAPTDEGDYQRYMKMVQVYRYLFAHKGISITVQCTAKQFLI